MTYKLYNDTVTLEFDEAKHIYTIDDKKVDGVTSALNIIAKPQLLYWAVDLAVKHIQRNLLPGKPYDEIQLDRLLKEARWAHKRTSGEAQDMGKMVHKFCEEWIAGKNPKLPYNAEVKNSCQQFLKWVDENEIEFLESERVVYSKSLNYAGTADFICKIDGMTLLGDFKSSKAIYDEYFFQTASYTQAYLEEFPKKKIDGNIIIRLGKDGVLEGKKNFEYEKNVGAFNAALTLSRRINELKDKELQRKLDPKNVMSKILIGQ